MPVVIFDELRTLAFGDIDATFVEIGDPISHNWRAFKITNVTDQDIIISLDGITDQIFVPSFGFTLYDLTTNSHPAGPGDSLVFEKGTQFFAKYVVEPDAGNLYIEGLFARGE